MTLTRRRALGKFQRIRNKHPEGLPIWQIVTPVNACIRKLGLLVYEKNIHDKTE